MNHRITLAPLLLLAIAAAFLVTGCGSSGNSVELSFKSSFMDCKAESTGSGGSNMAHTVAGHGKLINESGKEMGTFNVTSTVTGETADSETRFVNAEYSFGAQGMDSILISGAEVFTKELGLPFLNRPLYYAVVGGTGKYTGANGECLVHRTGENDFTTTCTFTTP